MIDVLYGERVRVVGAADGELDDEHGDARMVGRCGVVVGRIVNDHGATPRDPLLVLRFDRDPRGRFARDYRDAFWATEVAR